MALSLLTRRGLLLSLVVMVAFPIALRAQDASPVVEAPAGVTVIASGLTNPRGFTWGADGTLYLALAGSGGETPIVIEATPAAVAFMAGNTSSVATVADGCATPLVEGIGSLHWVEPGWTWGAMDVAILNGELYVLASAGTDLGGNGVYRVLADGTLELVADLAAWLAENPPAEIPWDYDPTGSWFDMEAGTDRLWVSEAVAGYLLTVTPDGQIEMVADLSEGHMVPTGVALDGEGGAYVGFETTTPFPDGASKVVHVAADGTVSDYWTGLTAVTDVVMGPDGTLYAAEMATNNLDEEPYLNPNSGRVVRMTGPDSLEEVVTDADYPVMLGFDDAGDLYIAYPAFGEGSAEGAGALIAVDLDQAPISLAGLEPAPTCPGQAATPVGGAVEVAIESFAFGPATLEVPAGTSVTWTNLDAAPHTVESADGVLDSGRLNQGDSFTYTFTEPGTYDYICGYHPAMAGIVVVT